jgi:toxin ParE1/3/4
MSYILSRKAEEDIIDIFLTGVEQFGQKQAEHYHEQLDKCFRFLAENPLAAHERFEITPPVRIHPVGSHLVIYRIEENGELFIIRVRHGHEDWQSNTDTT